MKKVTLLTIVVLLPLISPALSQVPDDKLIVPGQRIGKWTLTMTIADLTQINGPPSRVSAAPLWAPQDLAREFLVHYWERLGFFAATSTTDTQRVDALFATSDEFKTEKGIGVNSRREAVEAAYGGPTAETRPSRSAVRLTYDEIGLTIAILESVALAIEVAIFRPGTRRQLFRF